MSLGLGHLKKKQPLLLPIKPLYILMHVVQLVSILNILYLLLEFLTLESSHYIKYLAYVLCTPLASDIPMDPNQPQCVTSG